jgi:hypothetical protein
MAFEEPTLFEGAVAKGLQARIVHRRGACRRRTTFGLVDSDWRIAGNRHWCAAGRRFTAERRETMRAADFPAVEGLPKMLIMADPCASVASVASVEHVTRLWDGTSRRRVSFLYRESLLLRRGWPTDLEVHTESPIVGSSRGVTSLIYP